MTLPEFSHYKVPKSKSCSIQAVQLSTAAEVLGWIKKRDAHSSVYFKLAFTQVFHFRILNGSKVLFLPFKRLHNLLHLASIGNRHVCQLDTRHLVRDILNFNQNQNCCNVGELTPCSSFSASAPLNCNLPPAICQPRSVA